MNTKPYVNHGGIFSNSIPAVVCGCYIKILYHKPCGVRTRTSATTSTTGHHMPDLTTKAIRIKHTLDTQLSINQDSSGGENLRIVACFIVSWIFLEPLLQSSSCQHLVVDIGLKCKAMFAPPIQGEIETWIFGILLFLTFGKGLIKYQNIFYVWWMKKTLTKKGFIAIFQLISTKYSKDPSFVTKYNSFRTHMYDAGLKFILCWFALF